MLLLMHMVVIGTTPPAVGGPQRWMEETMDDAVRRVLSAAKWILAALGGLGSRPPTSQVTPGVEPVGAEGAAV